jgi:4-hydroxy-tetrahydrodipicolinate synthase
MKQFKGIGVAMVTPFKEDLSIDYPALQRLIEHMIKGGVDYLVVQGTTGESATISSAEKRNLLDFILEVNASRVPIVYGIGGNNTMAVCDELRTWDLNGVDGILSVSPYYNKPTQEGIYRHYEAISKASPLPIILYNVPGRTASNMSAETTLRLAADFENIVAVKEASGDLGQIASIIQHRPAGFLVISGDDALTLPMISTGADGLISVVGNAFPIEASNLVHKALAGEYEAAKLEHYKLKDIIENLFIEGNPAGVKECLKHAAISQNHVRLPLMTVSQITSERLYRLMAEKELVRQI